MKLAESEPKSRKANFAKDFAMVWCFFLTFFLIDIPAICHGGFSRNLVSIRDSLDKHYAKDRQVRKLKIYVGTDENTQTI